MALLARHSPFHQRLEELALRGVRSVRHKVLRPIEDMCAVTDQLARGQYDVRLTGEDEVQEIQTLRTTFNELLNTVSKVDQAAQEMSQASVHASQQSHVASDSASSTGTYCARPESFSHACSGPTPG